ncbi:hypothetical protein MFRU_010g00230 [Monilinia fructicola]|nr:hypothetical protein MFRU_010g00230 [Monilinia fructicola]
MSGQRKNVFPPEGDVLIMSPMGKQWKLHSWQLINYSPVLGTVLKKVPPRNITKTMRSEGQTIRWWVEMRPFSAFVDTRFRDLNGGGAYNGMDDDSFERTYDNLFRMLYNQPPNLTDDIEDNGATAYVTDCVTVLQAADYLCALPCVRTYIESYLLRITQKLWMHVARGPEAWSDIGVRLQSAVIYREAIVHIAGALEIPGLIKMHRFRQTQFGSVCLAAAESKALELREKKIDVERRLLQFYPARLIRRETAEKIPGRADYGADIYYWQALTMCRQFFQSSVLANRHHRHEDGGVEFYRTVFRCDYIDKAAIDEFHQLFAMSTKGKQCLADAIELIKDDHRVIVADLLDDNLQLRTTTRSKPLRYLTCTRIADAELPWIAEPDIGARARPGRVGNAVFHDGSSSPQRVPGKVADQGQTLSPERDAGDESLGGGDALGGRGEEGRENENEGNREDQDARAEGDEGELRFNDEESIRGRDGDDYMHDV